MNTTLFVMQSYSQYFREQGISLEAADLTKAIQPFNMSAVKRYVDNDIEQHIHQDPLNESSIRATRERFHQSNLRTITRQYASEVYRRQQRGETATEEMLIESRHFTKSAAAGCDLYPCDK